MIEIFIFQLHIIAVVYIFVKNWQNRTLRDAFLGLGVFLLVFSIGWALTGSLSYAIYPDAWKTPYFNHDTLSLVLLSIFESFFFYHFFFKDKIDEQNLKVTGNERI
ncbi:MAG TPA: hypothetical protein PLU67_08355 [Candidatus Kapabacteria bacterium]|jgi:hypothetical protein|nr:hypothetical protein [Candidatus Kapabacteria bacterium]HOM05488.1 hypothetical protein [Candidatus Kapabacteria bacterium]HOQ49014.1 hypothetical protein [Candidatus Kapabacteria bacterium]HPU22529.1 hypothetical protein [Candidatus Kapabacteria bacterium]